MADSLRYPLDRIDRDTDHMSINVIKYEAPGIGRGEQGFQFRRGSVVNIGREAAPGQDTNIIGNIKLPMPDNLTDSNAVAWNDSTLDARDAFILGTAKAVGEKLSLDDFNLTAAGGVLKGAFGDAYKAIEDQTTRDALEAYLLGQAANIFTGNVDAGQLVSRATGLALNPNLELLFKGPKLRTFTFPFTLTPRSREEGFEVKAIINTFKRRMAANDTVGRGSDAAGIFISAPDVFEIKFMQGNKPHPFLFEMKTAALTDMKVNYADGTPYSTYYDGTPVKLSMQMSFTELNPLYSSDYTEEPNANRGVGF